MWSGSSAGGHGRSAIYQRVFGRSRRIWPCPPSFGPARLLLWLVIALSACATPESHAPPVALQDFAHTAARAFCTANNAAELVWYPGISADQLLAICTDAYDAGLDFLRPRLWLASIGRVGYDPQAAGDCLAAVTAESFLTIEMAVVSNQPGPGGSAASPAACREIFTGSLPVGSDCDDDAECGTGSCGGCPGVCVWPAGEGAPCNDVHHCSGETICLGGVCVPNVARGIGDACMNLTWLNDYQFGALCTTGECIGGWDGVGVCTGPAKAGEKCGSQGCETGFGCRGGVCTTALPWGATCTAGSDDCGNGLFCAPTNTIRGYQFEMNVFNVGPGVCLKSDEYPCGGKSCSVLESCTGDWFAGTCVPRPAYGEACKPDHWPYCLLGACDAATWTCRPLRSCEIGCPSEACGLDGKCTDPRVGDACAAGDAATYTTICDHGKRRALLPGCTMEGR